MPSLKRVNNECDRILKIIQNKKFEDCLVIQRGFKNLGFETGIYAIKSDDDTVLYVGKASAFRTRFQGGHQTLNNMFLDGMNPQGIRLVTVPTPIRYLDSLLIIEKWIIFLLQPKYNKQIPYGEVTAVQQLIPPTTGHLKDVLNYLPDAIVEALEDHADAYGMTDAQILELAIAQFLDLESVSFSEVEKLKGLGALREENAILKARLQALGQSLDPLFPSGE
jgi:hypothetical protein